MKTHGTIKQNDEVDAMPKAAMMVGTGSEPIEVIAPVDVMRRASIDTDVISVEDQKEIVLAQNVEIVADRELRHTDLDSYDMIIVPGGNIGVQVLGASKELADALVSFMQQGKWVASICAGPTILADLHLLDGYKATCYPGCETNFPEGSYQPNGVYTDRNLITASGPAYALEFGKVIAAALTGQQNADQVAKGMLF